MPLLFVFLGIMLLIEASFLLRVSRVYTLNYDFVKDVSYHVDNKCDNLSIQALILYMSMSFVLSPWTSLFAEHLKKSSVKVMEGNIFCW